MIVQFNTDDLSERDAQCIVALLSPIAGGQTLLDLQTKDAVRRPESAFTPQSIPAGSVADPAPASAAPDAVEPAKKRGRPKKETAEIRPTDAAAAAGETPSITPESGNADAAASAPASNDGPISMDDLREAVNDHVSRNGMPSVQMVFKKYGCERVSGVMELEPAKQRELLAELKK